ncbi:nuclear transport factor 2 family protein [Streptomyces sp. NPDC093084]|uniref:nuclear transport factor 2 family protein n=1 Tax=Streptomyces sp. NPDC093084 TaxID=3155197 RepID=UPI00343EB01C
MTSAMTGTGTPAAVRTFAEAFAAVFTHDAELGDRGREYHGRDGVRAWDRTDGIGVQAHFTLDAIEPGRSPGTHVAALTVTGNGYVGTGPMTFRPRDGLIAGLRTGP